MKNESAIKRFQKNVKVREKMIEEKNRDIRITAWNFCPEDCKYRDVDSDSLYNGNEIVMKTECCRNMYICRNAAEAYEDFKKKEEKERKTEEKRKELINVTNEFKFR